MLVMIVIISKITTKGPVIDKENINLRVCRRLESKSALSIFKIKFIKAVLLLLMKVKAKSRLIRGSFSFK